VIGLARAVHVFVRQSQILDTGVFLLAGALKSLPASAAAIDVIVVAAINIINSSGAGQAAFPMSIFTPQAQRQPDVTKYYALGLLIWRRHEDVLFVRHLVLIAVLMVCGVPWAV
jgi:uncharacterized ion transporter superfamily protein YfcC